MTTVTPSVARPSLLHDIAPPVPFSLYPIWMILLTIFFGIVGLILLLTWRGKLSILSRKDKSTPGEAALKSLRVLHSTVLSPHDFGVEVSAILRRYIQDEYGVSATTQTSMEFLASIQDSSIFSSEEKVMLGKFLGMADLLKFSRAEAKQEETTALLLQAEQLVCTYQNLSSPPP